MFCNSFYMGKTEVYTFVTLGIVIILIFITGIVLFVSQFRKRKVDHIKETELLNQQHRQELLSTQLEIQNQTMQHIGREIHDSVGQKLTLASLYAQQLAYENKAPQVNDRIDSISSIINESLTELRRLSKSLTDDSIAADSIAALLQSECNKVNDAGQCRVHFSSSTDNALLTYQTKSILLRIVQEFMQNSIKHARCSNISVSLHANGNSLQLHLEDDGKGFDTKAIAGNGIGLSNMKKRAALIGGNFDFESLPGTGTKLDIEIPLQNNQ
jgi:signal transduction histidine kinase